MPSSIQSYVAATVEAAPLEILDVPLAVWALVISLFSLASAVGALAWQVAKHLLDGGRVKVYLNTAIYMPGSQLLTARSGKLSLKNDRSARRIRDGYALELAQLVVENPGRIPVTIYSPGLSFSGHGETDHSVVPRMVATRGTFGPDSSIDDAVVRLEPYSRVTFLLDYWSVMPEVLKDPAKTHVFVRGHVRVAGRTNRPQRSKRSLRWRIERGMHTAVDGAPRVAPISILWRELWFRLPERAEKGTRPDPESDLQVTRDYARGLLDDAMSRFDRRPDADELVTALRDVVGERGGLPLMLPLYILAGYEDLDRMEDVLTDWTESLGHRSLMRRNQEKRELDQQR